MCLVLGVQLAQHFNLGTINNSVSTYKKELCRVFGYSPYHTRLLQCEGACNK